MAYTHNICHMADISYTQSMGHTGDIYTHSIGCTTDISCIHRIGHTADISYTRSIGHTAGISCTHSIYIYIYIHICWFNFDALAQGNAYKPTMEPINYRGPSGDRTHDLQTEATPPAASYPARTLHATEIASKNANPITCPRLHWTTDNPSGPTPTLYRIWIVNVNLWLQISVQLYTYLHIVDLIVIREFMFVKTCMIHISVTVDIKSWWEKWYVIFCDQWITKYISFNMYSTIANTLERFTKSFSTISLWV